MNEEKLRILKMVESGVISADEAVKLIEALEKSSSASSSASFETKSDSGMKEFTSIFMGEIEKMAQKLTGARPKSDGMNQSKDKVMEFMQSAAQRLKEVEIPFVGKGTEFTHTFYEEAVQPSRLKVETANGSVTIRPWDGPGVKAECRVKVYGGATEEEARESFLKNSIFYAREDKLSFSAGLKLMKTDVTLFVPGDELDEIDVKMFNGGFDLRDVKVNKAEVKSGNGRIELKNCHTGSIEAETGNGPIRFIDCDGERAELNTFNGAVHLVGTYRFTDVQTFNGNILFDAKEDGAESVRAESMTGNIELYTPQNLAVKGDMRTAAGRFVLPETGMASVTEKDERIQKSVKFESSHTPDERVLTVDAETKTGSIALRMSSLRKPAEPGDETMGSGI